MDEDRIDEGAQDWNASFVIKLAESLETSRLPVAHIYTDILEICLIPLENIWNIIYIFATAVCRWTNAFCLQKQFRRDLR